MNKNILLCIVCYLLINSPFAQTQRILIDIGSSPNKGGVLTPSPDVNGNTWNNMTNASPGVRVTNAVTTKNIITPVGLQVVNRIDGTYNPAEPGTGNGNTIGAVGDYPASATNDYAYAHSSATNGKWKITGLNPSYTYIIKFWGAKSAIAFRDTEIKRSDESTWQGYSAANNTNFNRAAVFTISGKTEMDFDIRPKSTVTWGYVNIIDITFSATGPQPNQPPVARAGNDTSINLPVDSVRLNGCSSYDPEVAPLKYKWRKISGPSSFQMPLDTLCSVTVKNLQQGTYSFELAVTDTAGLTKKDTVAVQVSNIPATPWPVVAAPICSQPYKIVVLGSSTAFGTGTNPIDSSWVNKFRVFVQRQNPQVTVTNLATLGLTTFDVNPSGFVPPPGYRTPDTLRNITKAMSLNPDAIIINLPSNDIANGYTVQEFEDNMNRIVAVAYAKNVPVWVTTTQPRDNLNLGERNSQVILKDWINQRFGNFSIDFWTDIATANATITPMYGAGDGIHLNNYGHHILFTRVVYEDIWDTICNRKYGTPVTNKPPVAKAGADITVTLPATAAVNGTASLDSDGTITAYKWRKISGPAGVVITNDTARQTTISFTNSGLYYFELAVTDNKGAAGKDTLAINVNSGNNLPVAKAGNDMTIPFPLKSILLDGRSSSDPDGAITGYQWSMVSGNPGSQILRPLKDSTSVTFSSSGIYTFRLTVTDNKAATASDDIIITVLDAPGSAKIIRINIYGGINPYNNSQWNNWNVDSSLNSKNFLYEDGTASTVDAVLSAHSRITDNGTNYALGSTICPPAVLRYSSLNTSDRILSVRGLKAGTNYSFEFYASRGAIGSNSTVYTIGQKSDTIDPYNNITDYAKFDNITANVNGTIIVSLKRTSAFQYINGFIIKEQSAGSRPLSSGQVSNKENNELEKLISDGNNLNVYPNPLSNILNVRLDNGIRGGYRLQLLSASGKTVFSKEGIKSDKLLLDKINTDNLPKGIYFLQIISGKNKFVKKIIKN